MALVAHYDLELYQMDETPQWSFGHHEATGTERVAHGDGGMFRAGWTWVCVPCVRYCTVQRPRETRPTGVLDDLSGRATASASFLFLFFPEGVGKFGFQNILPIPFFSLKF